MVIPVKILCSEIKCVLVRGLESGIFRSLNSGIVETIACSFILHFDKWNHLSFL